MGANDRLPARPVRLNIELMTNRSGSLAGFGERQNPVIHNCRVRPISGASGSRFTELERPDAVTSTVFGGVRSESPCQDWSADMITAPNTCIELERARKIE